MIESIALQMLSRAGNSIFQYLINKFQIAMHDMLGSYLNACGYYTSQALFYQSNTHLIILYKVYIYKPCNRYSLCNTMIIMYHDTCIKKNLYKYLVNITNTHRSTDVFAAVSRAN